MMMPMSWKWGPPLLILLSFCIVQSCGFQVAGSFGKRRNQNSNDPFQSSCKPFLALESKGLSQVALGIRHVFSNRYPFALSLSRPSIENIALLSQWSPRYATSLSELRLHASPSDDEASPQPSRFRSVITKVVKILAFPVRFAVLETYRWIRSKFQSKEKVVVDGEEGTAESLSAQESLAGEAEDVLEIIKAKTELPNITKGRIDRSAAAVEPLIEPDVQIGQEPAVSETIVKVVQKTEEIIEPDVQTEQEPVISKTIVGVIEKTEQEAAIIEAVVPIVEKTEHEPAISETVVPIVEKAKEKKPAKKPKVEASGKPAGDRWAIAAPGVDLSGEWTLLVNEDFRKEYDEYLKQLGQPFIVRSVALTIIALTSEVTQQTEEGRNLLIRGTNARGIWKRTLVASGTDSDNDEFTPLQVPCVTADDERVEAEAWWEEEGTVHRSWMRGLNKYGGGDFESRRYLEDGGRILVCESTFHPREKDRKDATVTWRFLRDGEQLAIDET